jgi:hypothetical protein
LQVLASCRASRGGRSRESEDEGLSSAAQRDQIAELRRRNTEQLKALQAAHDEQLNLVQQEAAYERANREAILKSRIEQEHRAAEYGDRSSLRRATNGSTF